MATRMVVGNYRITKDSIAFYVTPIKVGFGTVTMVGTLEDAIQTAKDRTIEDAEQGAA